MRQTMTWAFALVVGAAGVAAAQPAPAAQGLPLWRGWR